jgi:hypothetical protein
MTNEQRAQELIRNHSLGGQTWGGLINAITAALDEKDRLYQLAWAECEQSRRLYETTHSSKLSALRLAHDAAAESAAQRKEGEK